MTRASWMTLEQRQWLEERLPEWSKAQAANGTKPFRSKLIAEWYKAFPLGALTAEELAKANGNTSQAERAKRTAMNNVKCQLRFFLEGIRPNMYSSECTSGSTTTRVYNPASR